jgi:hypothetical protein
MLVWPRRLLQTCSEPGTEPVRVGGALAPTNDCVGDHVLSAAVSATYLSTAARAALRRRVGGGGPLSESNSSAPCARTSWYMRLESPHASGAQARAPRRVGGGAPAW